METGRAEKAWASLVLDVARGVSVVAALRCQRAQTRPEMMSLSTDAAFKLTGYARAGG
jgi:hypothetical protein